MRKIVARIMCDKCNTIIESGKRIREDHINAEDPEIAYHTAKKKAGLYGWRTVIDDLEMIEPGRFDFCAECSEAIK